MQVNYMHKKLARNDRGFSLIELLIVVAIILIIAAIAIPNMLRTKQNANEAAAVSDMRSIVTAEATYSNSYGTTNGFASKLAALGPAATCDAAHACIIDQNLGCAAEPCSRNGYNFFLMSDSGAAPFVDFAITASPAQWNGTGSKNFCAAEDGVLRYEVGGTASKGGPIPHDTCASFAQYNAI
ncbi:MAG TPA: prepilin-type N-terminal cleavage/methylation domain-containing protein [Candidatus Angelobacter sp.]|jgi:prepilin-type N-terminal cleavage/methylation domain-containing protein|nr:prepilin-type N-terminal cleavage/methylation domain-containing protein [Candidatus Angelobacter sp.]